MSGSVQIITEPDGFAVACFRTDCWEHGIYGHEEPWVSAHARKSAAVKSAKAHRQQITEQGGSHCPTCGTEIEADR